MLLQRVVCSSLLAVGLAAQSSVFCVDSITDNLMALEHRTGAWTIVGSTANNGLSTAVDLTWRRLTGEMWTVDAAGGELGTLDLDDATFTPRHTVGTGGWVGLAWHEEDKRFYLAHNSGNMYSFDPVASSLTMLGPHGLSTVTCLEVNRFGKLLAGSLSGSVASIDTSSGGSSPIGSAGFGLAAFAEIRATGEFLSVNDLAAQVRVHEPSTWAVEATAPLMFGLPAVRGVEIAEQGFAYFFGADMELFAAEMTRGSIFRMADLGGVSGGYPPPVCLTYVPERNEIWSVSKTGYIFAGKSNIAWQLTRTLYGATLIEGWTDMTWDSRTNRFYLSRGGDIWSMGRNSGQVVPAASTGLALRAISAGPFGVLYGVTSSGSIYLIDTNGGAPTLLGSGLGDCQSLEYEWSTGDFLATRSNGDMVRIDSVGWTVETVSNQFEFGEHTYTVLVPGTVLTVTDNACGLALPRLASAYVCDEANDELGTINLGTGEAFATTDLGDNGLTAPAELTHVPGDTELWTVDAVSGEVGTIDPLTGKFEVFCVTGISGFQSIAWHEGDEVFYLGVGSGAGGNGPIYKLEPVTGELTFLGASGYAEPRGLDVGPDGDLYMTDFATGDLTKIDRLTGAASLLHASLGSVQGCGFEPGTGELFAVRSADDRLYRIDPDTGGPEPVGPLGSGWTEARGLEVIDGAGATVARTLIVGQSCGPIVLYSQEVPQLYAEWTVNLQLFQSTVGGVLLLGLSDPMLPLDPVGAPGCVVHTDAMATYLLVQTQQHTLDIPGIPALAGTSVYAQGVTLSQTNALGMIFSNGLRGVIGW